MMELALFAKSLSEKLSVFGLNCPYGYNGYQYILSSSGDLAEVECIIRGLCNNYEIRDRDCNGWVCNTGGLLSSNIILLIDIQVIIKSKSFVNMN